METSVAGPSGAEVASVNPTLLRMRVFGHLSKLGARAVMTELHLKLPPPPTQTTWPGSRWLHHPLQMGIHGLWRFWTKKQGIRSGSET